MKASRTLTLALATLLALAGAAAAGDAFHFTVTADMRSNHTGFAGLCADINARVGGPGAFHVSVGDIDGRVWDNRAVIDAQFGAGAIWYPVIGNHESEDGVEMEWLRNEYDNGNGATARMPLKNYTNQDGPTGTVRVNYSWDYGNAHFVALNEYWNGATAEGAGQSLAGSDTGADGNVVPALYNWLSADLAANTRPYVFVFGHEPAFPYNRHVGDSLDKYPTNRDNFWSLLEAHDAHALFVGHTHYYSTHQGDKNHLGDVWQIDVGNAGNDPGDGLTYVDVSVGGTEVRFDVYRSPGGWHLGESWAEPIPEPATLTLLGLGGLLGLRRRRRRA